MQGCGTHWHVLRYPATRNKWKSGRNTQQLGHFWPQFPVNLSPYHSFSRKKGSFGNLQQKACGNWQQIAKYCQFRQQLRKMWQQIPSRNTSIRAHVMVVYTQAMGNLPCQRGILLYTGIIQWSFPRYMVYWRLHMIMRWLANQAQLNSTLWSADYICGRV